jgi:hypothetical protein
MICFNKNNAILCAAVLAGLVLWMEESAAFCPLQPSSRLQTLVSQQQQATRLRMSSTPEIIVVFGGDDEENNDDEEEEEEEEEEEDPYRLAAATEFADLTDAQTSSSLVRSSNAKDAGVSVALATDIDWGGAIGKLRERVNDMESGKSQDPSHALFRVLSAQTPNQQIGAFIQRADPQVVQAMSGAVSSLLGGLSSPASGSDLIVRASREKMSSLCFQLQMTGYMFRNAEYVMALKKLVGIQLTATVQDYKDAFDDLDTDGSGFIEMSEIKELLDDVYDGKTPNFEIEAFLRFFDAEKTGKISWSDFERGLGSAMAKQNQRHENLKILAGLGNEDDDQPVTEPDIEGVIEIEMDDGNVVKMEAKDYITSLKQEARALKAELRREMFGSSSKAVSDLMTESSSSGINEFGGIASYIAKRRGDIKALTEGISPEIVQTMKMLVDFVLEGGDSKKAPKGVAKAELEMEIPGMALQQLALWQLVLGYTLRESEAKGDYMKILD